MRKWSIGVLLAATIMILATTLPVTETPASEPGNQRYLSLSTGALANLNDIPPNCADWEELWPNPGVIEHQGNYQDNGDGVVSPCDEIELDGEWWHITWAGPTYYLQNPEFPDQLLVAEPNLAPHDPANPTCEIWHEILPVFCEQFHVAEWHDADESGAITPCDWVVIEKDGQFMEYHVEDIRLNIIIERLPVSTETDTWSRIKNWFRSLGN